MNIGAYFDMMCGPHAGACNTHGDHFTTIALEGEMVMPHDHITAPILYKDISDFPGYQVGDDGSVLSFHKMGRGGGIVDTPRFLIGSSTKKGYLQVHLSLNRRLHTRYISRLVLEAFKGPCPEGMEACHEDGDKSNNRLGNLRWDTHLANIDDKLRHGTAQKGSKNPGAKLSDRDIQRLRELRATGLTQYEVADILGVCQPRISDIERGKSWSHIP